MGLCDTGGVDGDWRLKRDGPSTLVSGVSPSTYGRSGPWTTRGWDRRREGGEWQTTPEAERRERGVEPDSDRLGFL